MCPRTTSSIRHLLKTLLVLLASALAAAPSQTVRADDDPIPALFANSFAHESEGELAAALNDVLAILRRDDAHYFATLRAGYLYYLQARHDDALRMYRRAQELAPDALEPRLGEMLPLMAASRWSEAERLGQALGALAPRDYTIRSRLAWIAYSQGRHALAEARYRAVLADYPSDIEMRLGLGWSLALQGKKDEAAAAFRWVLSVYRDHVRAREGLQAL